MAYKPRATFRGNDKARLRALLKAINMVRGMDSRAMTRAAELDYDPTLFSATSSMNIAIQRLEDRIAVCLEMKS